MIINQPCLSCGVNLEKGTKTVAVFDIIKGSLQIMICSVLVVYYQPHPGSSPETTRKSFINSSRYFINDPTTPGEGTEVVKEKIEMLYYDGWWISMMYLVAASVEILLAILLYYGATKKHLPILHFWLIISGLLTPLTLILAKLYQLIVVCAYVEEIKCEAGGKALAEFRKLPYVCHIKSQRYPMPVHGSKTRRILENTVTVNSKQENRGPIFLTEKKFLMNTEASVFSVVQHRSYR